MLGAGLPGGLDGGAMTSAISTQALGSIARAAMVTEEGMALSAVLVEPHEAVFVRETATGLSFAPDTPIEIWALLMIRLIVQHKRVEWALADAVTFGEHAFADYEQWVQETGLAKRTLQNYARIGRAIEPARRRAAVSFAHHAEVVTLPAPEQEIALDAAERLGMTRYDLRDHVRERKRQLEDQPIADESLAWTPQPSDLTGEARAVLDGKLAGIGKRHRIGYERGFLDALIWADQTDAFREWKGPA